MKDNKDNKSNEKPKRKSRGVRKHIRRMKALARKEAVIVNPKPE